MDTCAPVVPGRFEAPDINGPWWGGAIVYTPWLYYQAYGDASLLAESYEGMKKHFAYLEQLCVNETARAAWPRLEGPTGKDVLWWGLGDWLAIEKLEGEGRLHVDRRARHGSRRSWPTPHRMLDRPDDQAHLRAARGEIRETFNRTFLNAETGVYDLKGGQTAQALALALGLTPERRSTPKVEARLVKAVEEANNHIASGFVGYADPADHAVRDRPAGPRMDDRHAAGYARAGSAWSGRGRTRSRGTAAACRCRRSPRRYTCGSWRTWPASARTAGFRRLVLRPDLVGGLTWVRAWHDGPNGRIASAWSLDGTSFRWDLTIPPNTDGDHPCPCEGRRQREGVRTRLPDRR